MKTKTDKQMLTEANEVLRSFKSVIDRKGEDTNWEPLNKKVVETLDNMFRHMKSNDSLILTIVLRLISFPFFTVIAFIGAMAMFIRWIFNFAKYGGESIAYCSRFKRTTIQDVFVELQKEITITRK